MKEYQKVADHYKNNDRPFWDIFDSDSDYKNFGIKAEQQALQVNQSYLVLKLNLENRCYKLLTLITPLKSTLS